MRIIAERLGVIDELLAHRQAEATASRPSIGLDVAKRTLHTELERRAWLD